MLEGTDVTYVVGQMGWPMNREILPNLSRTLTEGDKGFFLTCWAATEGASRPQGTSLVQPP